MKRILVVIEFEDEHERTLELHLPYEAFFGTPEHPTRGNAEGFRLLEEELQRTGVLLGDRPRRMQVKSLDEPPAWVRALTDGRRGDSAPPRRLRGCRSALALALCLLPATAREPALAEWVDELESAAAAGRPVVRRTVSLIFRAVPRLAWRARMPIRARGGRG